jgi:hypothetical protein
MCKPVGLTITPMMRPASPSVDSPSFSAVAGGLEEVVLTVFWARTQVAKRMRVYSGSTRPLRGMVDATKGTMEMERWTR